MPKRSPEGHSLPNPPECWLKADPDKFYGVSDGKILKGNQFPEGVLPVSAHEVRLSPSRVAEIELQILLEELRTSRKKQIE